MSGGRDIRRVEADVLDEWGKMPESVNQWATAASHRPLMAPACLGYSWLYRRADYISLHASYMDSEPNVANFTRQSEFNLWATCILGIIAEGRYGCALPMTSPRRMRQARSEVSPFVHTEHTDQVRLSRSPSGCAAVAQRLERRLPLRRTEFDSRRCRSRIFARGNHPGQCRWSAGFLGGFPRARGGTVVGLVASYRGEPGSIPGAVTPGFLHVEIVPDDAAGRRVFSGISSPIPRPFVPVLLRTYLASPSSTLKDLDDVESRPNLFTHSLERQPYLPTLQTPHSLSVKGEQLQGKLALALCCTLFHAGLNFHHSNVASTGDATERV
ncbi:hypothetical protein PR048_011659 [Dryococelus australis]|uniref:Uncharacterized protein n=1 Tax=Dryococelus australis TaxID=614101 RepID=A0ABQ9HMB2_9NEOP|nr:hypothetical protein PR048_011659 [Dryococelus australis]